MYKSEEYLADRRKKDALQHARKRKELSGPEKDALKLRERQRWAARRQKMSEDQLCAERTKRAAAARRRWSLMSTKDNAQNTNQIIPLPEVVGSGSQHDSQQPETAPPIVPPSLHLLCSLQERCGPSIVGASVVADPPTSPSQHVPFPQCCSSMYGAQISENTYRQNSPTEVVKVGIRYHSHQGHITASIGPSSLHPVNSLQEQCALFADAVQASSPTQLMHSDRCYSPMSGTQNSQITSQLIPPTEVVKAAMQLGTHQGQTTATAAPMSLDPLALLQERCNLSVGYASAAPSELKHIHFPLCTAIDSTDAVPDDAYKRSKAHRSVRVMYSNWKLAIGMNTTFLSHFILKTWKKQKSEIRPEEALFYKWHQQPDIVALTDSVQKIRKQLRKSRPSLLLLKLEKFFASKESKCRGCSCFQDMNKLRTVVNKKLSKYFHERVHAPVLTNIELHNNPTGATTT